MIEPTTSSAVSIWSYEGRSSRTDYFVVLLVTSVLGAIAGSMMIKGGVVGFFNGLIFAAVLWLSMCAFARRMHDVGHSGWLSLVVLVPGVNFIFGLYALFAPGQDRDNDFGPLSTKASPLPPSNEDVTNIQRAVLHPVTSVVEVVTQITNPPKSVGVEPEEEFWAQAWNECESAAKKTGLWAKAFADAGGEASVAKATYIRLRALQLQEQYSENQEALQRARDQALWDEQEKLKEQVAEEEALLAKMTEAELAEALLPKGRCPSCEAVILLNAGQCPFCTALFTTDSNWKVKPLTRYEAITQKAVDDALICAARTKEVKADVSGRSLIFLGILLLFIVLAVVNS